MKKHLPLLTIVIFLMLGSIVQGQCPEDPNDRGECDTMYVEPWTNDIFPQDDPPYFVRVPIYVTCDVVDSLDSISGFAIPLCYTHSNPSKYCSVSAWWNTTSVLWVDPNFGRSIFRHIVEGTDTLYHNRMADMAADFSGREWDTRIVDMKSDSSWCYYYRPHPDTTLDSAFLPPYFFMSFVPIGTQDQRWWEGSRILLATMTFKLEDTMTICLDTCWWPPKSHLAWSDRAASVKIPRPGTGDSSSFEVCFSLGPNFSIDATPDTQTLQAGQSADYDVILTSVFGFASPCTLTATGLPDDASADFDPNPVIPTDTSLMTINTEETTPSGTHNITITATELTRAQIEESTQVVLIITTSDVREIESSDEGGPSEFSLSQNYPNPFNPVTNFRFSLSKSAYVKIEIFNIVGQKVRTLVDQDIKPGVYVADWDGKDEKGNFVSSGIYFYRMQAGDFSDMKKMVLVK